MDAFVPLAPGAWTAPSRCGAARAVALPSRRALPRRAAAPVAGAGVAAVGAAADAVAGRPSMALKAGKFAPPRFYDFAPDAVAAVRLRHVQVESEALATAVVGLLKAGDQSLADLAASLSTDAASRARGGDLGWWDPHRGEPADPTTPPTGGDAAAVRAAAAPPSPPAALLAAATRVRPNTLQVVDSPAGWHVFVVEDARHALRPTLTLPPRAPDAFRHKAAAKGGPRAGSDATRGVPRPSPPTRMTYHITTLGCAMNEADSERMAAELQRLGYAPVADAQTAAVVVWNTCSIRDHAEQKVYSALGRHAARKWAAMGDVTLVVAGCVAQQEGAALLRRVPEVDLVLGPQYANRLGELLDDVRTNGVQVVATEPVHVSEDLTKPRRGSSTTAWVNVIYGCLERYVCYGAARRVGRLARVRAARGKGGWVCARADGHACFPRGSAAPCSSGRGRHAVSGAGGWCVLTQTTDSLETASTLSCISSGNHLSTDLFRDSGVHIVCFACFYLLGCPARHCRCGFSVSFAPVVLRPERVESLDCRERLTNCLLRVAALLLRFSLCYSSGDVTPSQVSSPTFGAWSNLGPFRSSVPRSRRWRRRALLKSFCSARTWTRTDGTYSPAPI